MDEQLYQLAQYTIGAIALGSVMGSLASMFKSSYLKAKSNNETAVARIEARTRGEAELQAVTDKAYQMRAEQLRQLVENPTLKEITQSRQNAIDNYLKQRREVADQLLSNSDFDISNQDIESEIDGILGLDADDFVEALPAINPLSSLEKIADFDVGSAFTKTN